MDNFSKLAFLAADILLKNENLKEEENNIAFVFSNKASSLDTDRKHQDAIENMKNTFRVLQFLFTHCQIFVWGDKY